MKGNRVLQLRLQLPKTKYKHDTEKPQVNRNA